jgi:hypothetical protein
MGHRQNLCKSRAAIAVHEASLAAERGRRSAIAGDDSKVKSPNLLKTGRMGHPLFL